MQEEFYLFPYKKVRPNEKVIIYGIGTVGRCFLSQIELNDYCQIVAVADKGFEQYNSSQVQIISPSDITKYDFDKLLITLKNKIEAAKVQKFLTEKYAIPLEKIILTDEKAVPSIEASRMACFTPATKMEDDKENISIAMIVSGGLGDQIINKYFLTAMLSCAKQDKCVVDLYVAPIRYKYARTIFLDCEYVHHIYPRTVHPKELEAYDIVFRYDYVLKFYQIDFAKINLLDPCFYVFLKKARDYVQEYGLDADVPLHRRIHFSRCRVLRRNCYTDYENLFEGPMQKKVDIAVDKNYEDEFAQINLGRYITINYGWGGHRDAHPEKIPNKVWDVGFYAEFNRMFHAAFQDVKIMQIGTKDGVRIDDVDYYLFGKDLEIVKYALRDSILHVDCEGGLVHLATHLGTKCVVLFGPTPVYYFGYEENINIQSDTCHDCCYLYDDFSICARGMEQAECMKSITPDTVMAYVKKYLKEFK